MPYLNIRYLPRFFDCLAHLNLSVTLATKAELLQEGIILLIHLFARAILLMKKLKIEETKAT